MSLKILINNEEVVCNSNIQIKEEMLSTSSTILKNCYPKSWENDKDYTSRYYFPKDYAKCKIVNEIEHPEILGETNKGTNLNIDYNDNLKWELNGLYGDTLQNGTPTPDTPVEIQSVTGLQNINVCGKNLFNSFIAAKPSWQSGNLVINEDGSFTVSENSGSNNYFQTGKKLKDFCPSLKVGDTVYLYLETTSSSKRIYISQNWFNGESKTLTETMLNSDFVIYGGYGQTDTIKIMITKQLETTYEPYKGNTYEVNLGKNLIYGENTTSNGITSNWNNAKVSINNTITSSWANLTPTISKRIPIGTYTFSTDVASGDYRKVLRVNYEDGTNQSKVIGKNSTYITFTLEKNVVSYFIFIDNATSGTTINDTFTVQLEKGSQATSYSPYFTPIELNKIGDYQDRIYKDNGKWYVEKKIGKVVLDGTQTIGNVNTSTTNTSRVNYVALASGSIGSTLICNRLTKQNNWNVDIEGISYDPANGGLWFRINKSTIGTTQNEVNSYLASNNIILYIPLATPTYTEITNTELINQLESIELLKGINNISITSENLSIPIEIHYNFKEAWTEEELIFCGCVKNTGNISLNPREPHFVDLQVLDFKTLLSEGDTLNYVITGKTIIEAINQVVNSISDYGFVVGNIQLLNPDEMIGAYSTLNKTAYDVFQYFADITQSRWTTRMIDENTIAIDFYDPTLMPQADPIMNTKEYMCSNKIDDISFSYSTNDYRNKQIMTSDEIIANITQTNTIVADGYATNFTCENKIGTITNMKVNGVNATFITKSEEELGLTATFVYQPGENNFESSSTLLAGSIITITYYPIVKGREIILNSGESSRINEQINRNGNISRYENRQDATSSAELQKIGQSYIKYKGKAEINLKVKSEMDLFNVGQIVEYQAPLEELATDYMVKSKTIDWYVNADKIFYTYELTSNFNYENAVNYFDNQRAKNQGNIGEGQTITRNIDLEATALIKFYDTDVEEIEVLNPTSLDFALDGVLI